MLADLHYSKAAKLFQLLRDAPCELLRVQLERVAFAEFQMSSKSDFSDVCVLAVFFCIMLEGGRAVCGSWIYKQDIFLLICPWLELSLHVLKCFLKPREMNTIHSFKYEKFWVEKQQHGNHGSHGTGTGVGGGL